MAISELYQLEPHDRAIQQSKLRPLIKSNDPIKRVMHWWKLDIGVSHDPGDRRHNRPMKAGYGHIRRSYGDAEDGMAIDVYIGADLASHNVFRVKQVRPETGEFDEWKYIIGTWTEQQAKELFLAHMPKRFFGGIETIGLNTLSKYQSKSLSKAAQYVMSQPSAQRFNPVLVEGSVDSYNPDIPHDAFT